MDHFCILFLIEKDVPARHERRTTCRWGISRLCVNRNLVVGIADGQCPLPPATAGGYRAVAQWVT